MAILFISLLSLLICLSLNVINSGYVTFIDSLSAEYFFNVRDPALISVFSLITLLGGWQITFSLVFLSILLLQIKYKVLYVLPLLITFGAGELSSTFGKLLFQRIRPDSGVIELSSYSFPSGHSTMAMALYGFMIYIAVEQMRSRKAKIGVVISGSTLILAIGFSRLYLGVHYLSDVVGGFLLGSLCLIIGIAILNWLRNRNLK